MLVEVLKSNYVIVLAEDKKDLRWLNQSGYMELGEDYYQVLFSNQEELISEVKYLLDYEAEFEDRNDEDAPFRVLNDLKEEGFIK